jgi:hypothetical protein
MLTAFSNLWAEIWIGKLMLEYKLWKQLYWLQLHQNVKIDFNLIIAIYTLGAMVNCHSKLLVLLKTIIYLVSSVPLNLTLWSCKVYGIISFLEFKPFCSFRVFMLWFQICLWIFVDTKSTDYKWCMQISIYKGL